MVKSRFEALREHLFSEPVPYRQPSESIANLPADRRPSEPIANLEENEEVKSRTVAEVDSSATEEDKVAAATRIQAAVRRYNDRRQLTRLIHLRKITSVIDTFSVLRTKVEDPLYMERICSDYTAYSYFSEKLFNPLLFELNALQGVHPDLQYFHQSVIRELVEFKKVIDVSIAWGKTGHKVNVGHTNLIPHTDGVSDDSPKRIRISDDILNFSLQSSKRQHCEHPNEQGRALETLVSGEGEVAEHSQEASASRFLFGDRKGKALETPVIRAEDDISLGERSEHALSGCSSWSADLNYEEILMTLIRPTGNIGPLLGTWTSDDFDGCLSYPVECPRLQSKTFESFEAPTCDCRRKGQAKRAHCSVVHTEIPCDDPFREDGATPGDR